MWGSKELRSATLRLVRGLWRFGLRESLGRGAPGRLSPRDLGPNSQPSSRLLLYPQPILREPLGTEWSPFRCGPGALLSWCPGVIVPKPSFPVPSRGVWKSQGRRRARPLAADSGLGCALSSPQEARLGHIPSQSLLRDRARRTGSEPEEKSERSRGQDVGEGSERQVGREEVIVIRRREKPCRGERDKGRWMNKRDKGRGNWGNAPTGPFSGEELVGLGTGRGSVS